MVTQSRPRKLTAKEIEEIEDREDLAAIAEWEEEKRNGTAKTVPLDEALRQLGLERRRRSAA